MHPHAVRAAKLEVVKTYHKDKGIAGWKSRRRPAGFPADAGRRAARPVRS